MPVRVVRAVLVESNPLTAEQLRRDLWGDPVLSVVAVVRSADAAAAAVSDNGADVAVVDTAVPLGVAALAPQLPVVAVATADTGVDALAAGAVDVWVRGGDMADLAWRAIAASTADVGRLVGLSPVRPLSGSAAASVLAIGAGTGGTAALAAVLVGLPADAAAVALAPLPAAILPAWLKLVAARSAVRLAIAHEGDRIDNGRVLVAPGDQHLLVRRAGSGGWAVSVKEGPVINHHRPSLDVLLNAVAAIGPSAVAAILGGVGPDGVRGLMNVRSAGGRTLAESPETAVCTDRVAYALRCGAAEAAASADRMAVAMVGMTDDHRPNLAA